jgi:uncharacterized membrane protein YphA (DoxX/SURF4 family)
MIEIAGGILLAIGAMAVITALVAAVWFFHGMMKVSR